eukprot:Sdes_comp20210_c0_seq1m13555
MLHCVAIMGRDNRLLFWRIYSQNSSVEFNFMVHSSLDIFAEKLKNSSQDSFLGLLQPLEDFKIYGYQSNTGIKFVAVLDFQDSGMNVKSFFKDLHLLYINSLCNPFQEKIGHFYE